MKQKLLNKCITIFNILVVHMILLSLYIVGNQLLQENFNLRPEIFNVTLLPISDLITQLPIIIVVLKIEILVINLIAVIQNRKNFKLAIWYFVSAIYGGVNIAEIDFIDNYKFYILQGILLLALLINFLINIKQSKLNVKKAIIYFITFVLIIVSAVLGKSILIYVAFIMQWINNKDTKDSSKKLGKIFKLLIAFILLISVVYSIGLYSVIILKGKQVYQDTCAFVDKIVEELKAESFDENEFLISVEKNGKYGYIDKNGKEIIPCKYDKTCGPIFTSENYCSIAKIGDDYYVFSKKGTILNQNKNIPTPYFEGKRVEESVSELGEELNLAQESINSLIRECYKDETKLEDDSEDTDDLFANLFKDNDDELETEDCHENDNGNLVYTFNLKSGKVLELEKLNYEDESVTEDYENESDVYFYNMAVLDDGNTINEYKKIIIPVDISYFDEDSAEIESFSDGYIPYYDPDNKKAGLFDLNNFEKVFEIQGECEIVEKTNDWILVRDYSDLSNIQEHIFNFEGDKLFTAKLIKFELYGFLVKKDNNKFSYYNENLEEKIKDFDLIWHLFDEKAKDFFTCGEENNDGKSYVIYNKDGELITNKKYEGIDMCNQETEFEDGFKRGYLTDVYKELYNIEF